MIKIELKHISPNPYFAHEYETEIIHKNNAHKKREVILGILYLIIKQAGKSGDFKQQQAEKGKMVAQKLQKVLAQQRTIKKAHAHKETMQD